MIKGLLAREDARDVWAFAAIERIWRDAVYAVRGLRREPTFALTALVTLALGAVTTITIFTIVDAELWKPLPFPNPNQLVAVEAENPGGSVDRISGADLADWNAQSRLVEYVGARRTERRTLRRETAESVTVRAVTPRFFSVLGVAPSLGRAFAPEDGRGKAAIVSDGAWHRLFDADPLVVGRTIAIDEETYTVVGVTVGMRLEFDTDPDFFLAIDASQPAFLDRQTKTVDVYGRMHSGVYLSQARSELQGITARIASAYPGDHADRVTHLYDLQAHLTGYNWRELYLFLGAAALVMVLSCLNVANLLLSRALRRQREFAIRGALGEGRGALVRQLLVEGAALAIPGAAVGVLASAWTVRGFAAVMPPDLVQRGGLAAANGRAVMFATGLSLVITIVLALSPLLFARRLDLNAMLGQGTRIAGRSLRQRRLRDVLLIAQVTVTLVLLTSAGLFMLSFLRLIQTPVGFDPENRLSVRITLSGARYREDPGIAGYANRLLDEAAGTAGVRDAAIGSGVPFDASAYSVKIVIPGRPRPAPGSEPTTLFFSVTPEYFRALGIPLSEGRGFDSTDVVGAPRVALVNERLARRMFPGENPVGKELDLIPRSSPAWPQQRGMVSIVGVVADIKNFGKNETEFGNLFVPFAQAPSPDLQLIASTSIPSLDVVTPLRLAAARVDASVSIRSVSTLPGRIRSSLDGARFNLTLITVFAALALVVAAVGIYGSVAYAIEERSREFGVRIALGAAPRAIFGEALRESIRVAIAGSLLGAVAVIALAKILGSALYLVPGQHLGMLYDVSMTNPAALSAAGALLIGVAVLAGLSPAREATRVDPLVVLRAE